VDYLVHHVGKKLDSQVQSAYTAQVTTKAGTPRRLTARGAATRARIVAAAASLVYERGFAGTSLDDVMAATGTSKSQLYHYFADKDALVREVIKAQFGRISGAQQAAGLREVSSWQALQRWCDHFVTATRATQGAGGCPLGSLVGEVADQSEPARRVLAQCFADWQSYLAEGFTAMRDNGELAAPPDPAELALTMITALQGGLLMAQATRSPRPLELALDMALQHIAAYRPRPESQDGADHRPGSRRPRLPSAARPAPT
jgi:TetR/AcrR family transcriptional regulator, transcriptional repressor for nem operon